MQVKNHIISDWNLFLRLKTYEQKLQPEYLVLDCETDGLNEKTVRLFGLGLCFDDSQAFYIVWRNKEGAEVFTKDQQNEIKTWLKATAAKTKVIGHNIVYDILVLENTLSIDLTDRVYADTVLMKHTINEEPPHGLKDTAVAYLGPWANKAQSDLKDNVIANGGRWVDDQKDMYKADTAVLAEYCNWDVLLTYKLFKLFSKTLKEENLEKLFYEEEIMPLYREVTIDMKRKGFHIDLEYFKNLNAELEIILQKLEVEVQESIADEVQSFTATLLDDEFPVKPTGNFPKAAALVLGIPLPQTKDGKITLGQAAIKKQNALTPQFEAFYKWLTTTEIEKPAPIKIETGEAFIKGTKAVKINGAIPHNVLKYKHRIQKHMWDEKYPDRPYIFNLGSNDHLGYFFTEVKQYSTETTETGKPQIDAKFLDSIKASDEKVQKLLDLKKLRKIKSTYIEGILDRQVSGVIYTSWLQFGTTSGRFSSRDPNLMNLPRVKEDDSGLSELVLKYVNSIKKGFIAPEGYSLVNADYSQLEPVCFSVMSGDDKLQNVFRNKLDLYSQVAIDVFKLTGVTANKKDPNFLKNLYPEKRQTSKQFCLAVPYGAEAAQVARILGIEVAEAEELVEAYLNAYPNLRKYMSDCNISTKSKGRVVTKFGRVRHLDKAKELYKKHGQQLLNYRWAKANNSIAERAKFKNYLNNAKNFPIQGLAAHIVNRAMIAISREFIKQGIDGHIVAQVHDEITCVVRKNQVEIAKGIVRECMENTTKIGVPLTAEPIVGQNWAESK